MMGLSRLTPMVQAHGKEGLLVGEGQARMCLAPVFHGLFIASRSSYRYGLLAVETFLRSRP